MTFIDFAKEISPFDGLSEQALQPLKDALLLQYLEGTTILEQQGPRSEYVYLIYQGTVRLLRDGQTVNTLEPGDMFGYPSLISQTAPEFDVIAHEDSTIYRISGDPFLTLLAGNPELSAFFSKGLAERLRYTNHIDNSTMSGNLMLDVGSLVEHPPSMIEPTTPVGAAARLMRDKNIGSLLIKGTPPGIVTKSDLALRVLAEERSPHTLIHEVMTHPVKSVPSDMPIYSAMFFMLEEGIHRLPLTLDGEIVGLVSVTDLLRHQTDSPFHLFHKLQIATSAADLSEYAVDISKIVSNLLNGGLDVAQIGRMVASLNDALVKRLLLLAEAELGPPPTPYAWLVFGSEGRLEQLLLTDQDNALVYQDDTPEAATYFAALSQRVVAGLIEAGFPPCDGGYMATHWCKPMTSWEGLFKQWIHLPEPQALLEAAIFFDFRAVHGALSVKPLDDILLEAKNQTRFLAQLAGSALEFRPPLGLFRRIIKDEGRFINLKKSGIAPIVGLARIYGLEAGIYFPTTLERLEGATKAGLLSQDGADVLTQTFRYLLRLRLQTQLTTYQQHRPDNRINWDKLAPIDRRHLKEAFVVIKTYQDYLAERYQTTMLG